MNIYAAKWPDGSISIVAANNKVDLFDKLDREGDPFGCQLFQLKSETDEFHLTFNVKKQNDETLIELDQLEEDVKLKKTKLPKDAFGKNLSTYTGQPLKEIKQNPNLDDIKKQMGIDQ